MPINQDALKRDVKACIRDLPVTARHNEKELTISVSSQDLTNLLMEGGLLDKPSITVTAVRDDFTVQPQVRDAFEIRLRGGEWITLEIKSLPDLLDPTIPDLRINLSSADAP